MAQAYPSFFPTRVNMRTGSAHGQAGTMESPGAAYRVDFGAVATAASLYTSAALTTGAINTLSPALTAIGGATARWGRGLTVEASAACTRTFKARGYDYMGQRVSFNGTMNGTTPVDIPKAFRSVDTLIMGASADTVTVTIKNTDKLGLPKKATVLSFSLADGVTTTAGTLAVGIDATPSGTNGDTRGTYDPNAACNGTIVMACGVVLDHDNLDGLAQFND